MYNFSYIIIIKLNLYATNIYYTIILIDYFLMLALKTVCLLKFRLFFVENELLYIPKQISKFLHMDGIQLI